MAELRGPQSQLQKAPGTPDLPSKSDEKLTGDASSPMTSSPATASVTRTEPGSDSQQQKKQPEISESAFSAVIPSPKEAEKKTTAVDQPGQAEGQQEGWAPGTKLIGMTTFPGSASHDLPFMRGDRLTVICRSEDPNWYKARRYDGLEGMIPRNHVKTKHSHTGPRQATDDPRQAVQLLRMPWFHGYISRESAEQLLKPFKNGKFLLWEGDNYKGNYTLSVSCETKVEHYRVQRNDISWVTIDSEEYFENLVKLVEHYQKDADGLCCWLEHPVKTSGNFEYTVSIQDFKESTFSSL